MSEEVGRLTSGRVLARNVVLNLVGQGAPLVVALVAIPFLLSALGTDRFGVLTLAWVAVGYFGLFDLGLGRALTQLVAERLGSRQEEEIPRLVWTGLLMMMVLGLLGGLVVAGITPWLVDGIFEIPEALAREALLSFYLLAAGLPWVVSTAGLRGVLEAKQRFGLVNAVRVPMGVYTYLGPLLVLPFAKGLVPVVAVLIAGRVVAWVVHLVLCIRVLPQLREVRRPEMRSIRPLLRTGSWMTVTNIVGPIMVYFDRFLIGAMLSVAAVAYYATPYEVVTKLWLIPTGLLGVFFPAFAASYVADRERFGQLLERALRIIFLLIFPVVFLLVLGAREGLALWLGPEFSENSTVVLQLLAVGVLINSVAQVPFSAIQGMGRPDLTGKLHLLELPLYLGLLWWLGSSFGIVGIAIAWVVRVGVDTLALFLLIGWLAGEAAPALRGARLLFASAVPALAVAALVEGRALKVVLLVAAAVAYGLIAWRVGLLEDERRLVSAQMKRVRGWSSKAALGHRA